MVVTIRYSYLDIAKEHTTSKPTPPKHSLTKLVFIYLKKKIQKKNF